MIKFDSKCVYLGTQIFVTAAPQVVHTCGNLIQERWRSLTCEVFTLVKLGDSNRSSGNVVVCSDKKRNWWFLSNKNRVIDITRKNESLQALLLL